MFDEPERRIYYGDIRNYAFRIITVSTYRPVFTFQSEIDFHKVVIALCKVTDSLCLSRLPRPLDYKRFSVFVLSPYKKIVINFPLEIHTCTVPQKQPDAKGLITFYERVFQGSHIL